MCYTSEKKSVPVVKYKLLKNVIGSAEVKSADRNFASSCLYCANKTAYAVKLCNTYKKTFVSSGLKK